MTVRTSKNRNPENVGFEIEVPALGERIVVPNDEPGFTNGVFLKEFASSDQKRQVIITASTDHEVTDTLVIPAGTSLGGNNDRPVTLRLTASLTEKIAADKREIIVQTYRDGHQSNVPFMFELSGQPAVRIETNHPGFQDGILKLEVTLTAKPQSAKFHVIGCEADTTELNIPAEKPQPQAVFTPVKPDYNLGIRDNFTRSLKG